MAKYVGRAVFTVFLILFSCSFVFAADCFIKKNCFGVIQPYLLEKVCFLFNHETKIPDWERNEADISAGALGDSELSVDRLHVEFVKYLLEKRFIVLDKGTPISDCGFDLDIAQNDPYMSTLLGSGTFPVFNCRGAVYPMIPVKPVNQDTCYWVAVANLECRFYPLTKRHLTDDEYE